MKIARSSIRLSVVAVLLVALSVIASAPASADPVVDIGELRVAVDEANADPGDETIDLVAGTTYSISGDECDQVGEDDDDENVLGDLDVFSFNETEGEEQDLTIQTPAGAPAIIEVACPQTRAIEVVSSDLNSAQDVTAQDSLGLGTLTLRNVVIRGGRAPSDFEFDAPSLGGGVFAFGANVVLDRATFDDNATADGIDGEFTAEPKVASSSGMNGGFGGGLAVVVGDIDIVDSTFNNNRAGAGGDGFDGACENAAVSSAGLGGEGGSGGAIFSFQIVEGFAMVVDTSTFTDNRAGDGGAGGDGAPAVCSSEGAGSDGAAAGRGGLGGGVIAFGSTLTVAHSAFSGNTAGDGGAGGSGSDGEDAVAPAIAPADVAPAQIGPDGGNGGFGADGGNGGDGGAVVSFGFDLGIAQAEPTAERLIVNSTFDGNISGDGGQGGDGGNGGAAVGDGFDGTAGAAGNGGCGGRGGAVSEFAPDDGSFCSEQQADDVGTQQVEGALALVHDTITNNGGGGAGGAAGSPGTGDDPPTPGVDGDSGGGSLLVPSLEATGIVVGTSDGSGPDCWFLPLFAESSFSSDDSCGFGEGSVQPFASFALTAFGDHGGPTSTRVPQADSVLLNVVAPADCSVADDQRLFARPSGAGCEVGAVEVSPVTIAATKTAFDDSVEVGDEVSFKLEVTNTSVNTPQPGVAVADTNCGPAALTEGDVNGNGTLDPGETWTYVCTVTTTQAGTLTNTVTFTVTDTDGLAVSAQATDIVQVTAPAVDGGVGGDELARTGRRHTGDLTRFGTLLIGLGTLLVLKRPFGRHYRKRGLHYMTR